MESEWCGTQEAADLLGIQVRTLYRLMDLGELTSYRIGRVIRIRRADIDAFLEAHRVKPGELRHLYPSAVTDESGIETAESES